MNFQTICRICIGKKSGFISIFETHDFAEHKCEISKIVTLCASVQVEKGDGFSEQICRKCLDLLTQAYIFKKLTEESDYKFRNHLVMSDGTVLKVEQSDQAEEKTEDNDVGSTILSSGTFESIVKQEPSVLINFPHTKNGTSCEQRVDKLGEEFDNNFTNLIVNKVEIESSPEETIINLGGSSITTCLEIIRETRERSDKENKKKENNKVGTTTHSSDALERMENQEASLTNLPLIENGTSTNPELLYKCEQCGKTLVSKDYLDIHLKIHTIQQVDILDNNSDNEFRNDLILNDEVEMKFVAEETIINFGEISNTTDVEKTRNNANLPSKCGLCDKSFATDECLETHMKIHPEQQRTTINVLTDSIAIVEIISNSELCNEKAPQNKTKEIQDKENASGSSTALVKFMKCKKPQSERYIVPSNSSRKCELYVALKKCLPLEERIHREQWQHKNDTLKSDLVSYIKVHTEEKQFKCNICDKIFALKCNLVRHFRVHTAEEPYKCEICAKTFAQKSHLVSHLERHTAERPFECGICAKKFVKKSHLESHLQRERPFDFEICAKKNVEKSGLVKHIPRHTGVKLFECEICAKKFTQKCSLTPHIRTHTGEKPFKCKICAKKFTKKCNLVYHFRLHTGEKPFKCKICDKTFTIKSNLMIHSRLHTGEKPFKCDICAKKFAQKNHLVIHFRRHTGERPFECEICAKKFVDKSVLVRHIQKHTRVTSNKQSRLKESWGPGH